MYVSLKTFDNNYIREKVFDQTIWQHLFDKTIWQNDVAAMDLGRIF